ncbi:MAG: hypothetical protein EBT69_09925, partial [Verrucomicrobia bacterium]|nr:hypothetical protein [Verrucomicrobiota bacterium]
DLANAVVTPSHHDGHVQGVGNAPPRTHSQTHHRRHSVRHKSETLLPAHSRHGFSPDLPAWRLVRRVILPRVARSAKPEPAKTPPPGTNGSNLTHQRLPDASWCGARVMPAANFFAMNGNKPRLGQLLITIDPGLSGAGTYNKRIAAFLAMLASDDGIRLPGQRRFAQRAQAMRAGVTVNDTVVQEINSGISKRWTN